MKTLSFNFILTGLLFCSVFGCQTQKSKYEQMVEFGKHYTDAWNSLNPEKVVSYYAEDGSLTINNGTPSVGRDQLAATVKSYMEAFPDMTLTMDSLVQDSKTYRYYWTFTGTNTGPGGTGNKVEFSGFEHWTMNDEGLVQTSIGEYDAEDYNKQLKGISD